MGWQTAILIVSSLALIHGLPLPPQEPLVECDVDHPCPTGYSCYYGAVHPTTKACYRGPPPPAKRTGGYCPRPSGANPINGKWCNTDADCPDKTTKCCNTGTYGAACVQIPSIATAFPKVTVLVEGIHADLGNSALNFKGTISLIQSKGRNILFDTGMPSQRLDIVKALQNMQLTFNDLDMVVMSHGHPAHLSGASMFPDIPVLYMQMYVNGSKQGLMMPMDQTSQYLFGDENLELILTPGHTEEDQSLIVHNVPELGTVAVSGDVFLLKDDDAIWPNFDLLYNVSLSTRKKVACMSDYIVPGHGGMFQVDDTLKQKQGC